MTKKKTIIILKKNNVTLDRLGFNSTTIETQKKAQQALQIIKDTIMKKDSVRAYYGTLQNRLENTITNLTTDAENLNAAESRISNTNIAKEMISFVKHQILSQSAIAMLTQANTFPQMTLKLIL